MDCSIQNCPGKYEKRLIVHTVRYQGDVVVFDHVPAEVCTVCGDILLDLKTLQKIEDILQKRSSPERTVPLYEYA